MVLSTHAVVGGALGRLLPGGPIIALAAGFVSHFLLDLIPHWDYQLDSVVKNGSAFGESRVLPGRLFWLDVAKVLLDLALGALVVWLFFSDPQAVLISVWWGAFGGVLPDGLQFLYLKFKPRVLLGLQHFHQFVHSNHDFRSRPVAGISYQVLIVAVAVLVGKIILS
jgi:hypothetical protein